MVIFCNVNDSPLQGETCCRVDQIFKANEKITRVFEYKALETGTYILNSPYHIIVDDISIQNKLDDILLK
ncbi:MAG: hypothetical protein NWF02_05200 [Candidatus Bathyarchaeota archaeon]|nr:hypothetical protein [Candidatus Bathyarchaeum sp.]